jgi:hypothetical protein
MGEDEVGTIRTLNAYKELMMNLIQQYRGRVVDAPGDNLLAEFGSVVDTVQCAVEIQKELKTKNSELPETRRMEFRIGINLGDVVEEEGKIFGDGVNIAARMESLADGGGICISGTAYDQVENKLGLSYESLGQQTVKNIAKPVRVYRVLIESGTFASTDIIDQHIQYVPKFLTPDWLHQLLWFVAGILATGAVWYFLSQKDFHRALWAGFGAIVVCLFCVALLIRNDLIRRELQHDSSSSNHDKGIPYTGFQQFTCNAIGVNSTIDVNKDLLKFLGPAANELRSRTAPALVISNNLGTIRALNFTNAQVSFTLTGDMAGITTIQMVNAGTTTAVGTFAIGTGTASLTMGLQGVIGLPIDILITIDSTTIKDDRAFNLNISIGPANDILQSATLINADTTFAVGPVHPGKRAIVWATNGVQFVVPDVRSDASLGISTSIRIVNAIGGARNYWLLVNSAGKWAMIKSKQPMAAGSVTIFTASGIITGAASIVTLPTTGFATRIVVDEVNNPWNVAVYATQYAGGSYRHLQVMKNAG